MNKTLWVMIGIVVSIGLYTWMSYNSFISASVAIDGQWAQVETQYQRRFDLIPNLVASVRGILKQEQEVFGALADARTRYAGAVTVGDKVQAASAVETALGRLLVIMENYPQLRSAENVTTLMVQLEGTENRISVERSRFNESVRDYNGSVMRFPSRLVARMFGFSTKPYFEAAQGAEAVPKVEL